MLAGLERLEWLMLTLKSQDCDKVQGLVSGADDLFACAEARQLLFDIGAFLAQA